MLKEDFLISVRQQVNEYCSEKQIPGFALGILHNGQIVEKIDGGSRTLDAAEVPNETSIFRIASMTKSFTAASILLLRDRGALRLDDHLVDILPWTRTIGAPENSAPISVRDLLTMNAGFPTDDPWGDRQENLPLADFDSLVQQGLSFARAPRTGFEYSNLGYALLGRVIATVSGTSYQTFVQDNLLTPLGMTHTHYEYNKVPEDLRAHGYALYASGLVPEPQVTPGAFSAMGGLHSSVRDLGIWVNGFISAHHSGAAGSEGTSPALDNSSHPLSIASRLEMQEHQRFVGTTISGDPAKSLTLSYGYGLMTETDSQLGRFVFHGGGYPGFGSFMKWHPASTWGIVVLGNRTYAPVYLLAIDILNRIVAQNATTPHPSTTLWTETQHAMTVAEQLINQWDESLADAHFAVNMDMDTPRAERQAGITELATQVGPFTRLDEGWISRSPAHVQWTIQGAENSARVEILMSPQRPTKIQSLKITAIESGASNL